MALLETNWRRLLAKTIDTISTKTARKRLPISRKATFVALDVPGVGLGYRRVKGGAGSWVVRIADGQGGYEEKRFATADDFSPANDKDVLDFAQAAGACRRLARTGSTDDEQPSKVVSVKEAIDAYAAGRSKKENVGRVRLHVPPALQKRPVALLTSKELMTWRDGLAKRLAPSSVNRIANVLRAVLNRHADSDDTILSRRAWEVGLAALPEATEANNVVIDDAAIGEIIMHARADSVAFGLLCETLAQTGARVSQLARCQVRDLIGDGENARLMIPSSAKGQKKRMTKTPVPIPAVLADRLRVAATGRALDARLLVKPSGRPWARSDHDRPFERARKAAGLPDDVSAYALRHSHITAQLLRGLPVQLVARLHDTSASQIEKHYAAQIAGFGDERVREAMADFDRPGADVVPMRQQKN
jgi:integrase